MSLGKLVPITDSMMELFVAPEGQNAVYYGKTRNGKTRNATADIIELLNRGEIVVANWPINFEGYDERFDRRALLVKLFFRKRLMYKYGKENFYYIDPIKLIDGTGEKNISWLNKLVGAHVYIDEGQWVLPSMDKSWSQEQVEKMKLVLHGGHYCRSLNIITQRASNISKNTRSQINVWYRCVKRFDAFGFMLFQRWAIEDMKDDLPVEYIEVEKGDRIKKVPNGELKSYFFRKRGDPILNAYNTHAMREKGAIELPVAFEPYVMTFWEKIVQIFKLSLPGRAHSGSRPGDELEHYQ